MNIDHARVAGLAAGLCLLLAGCAQQPPKKPNYAAEVPASIRTPASVPTKTLGTLEFFDGMPSVDTVAKTQDYLDVARAAEAFLAGVPIASAYSVMEGFGEVGMRPGDLGIAEDLLDARSLFLTPNTSTVYAMLAFDVKDGPVVLEVPPGVPGLCRTRTSAMSSISGRSVRTRARAASSSSPTTATRAPSRRVLSR